MSELTGDLVEEILCHVPAASLKRLRSTCKQWNHLFSDSRFTRKHMNKAAKQILVLVLKEFRVYATSINLHRIPSVEITGELRLIDPLPNSDRYEIDRVFHCDGLLLCTSQDESRIVVWNPCTGQSKWIQPGDGRKQMGEYALGSYKDISSGNCSYKILYYYWYNGSKPEFKIYDINSNNSWRILDVNPSCDLLYLEYGVSLNGKTYWLATDDKNEQLGLFIVSFDYTTERFGRLPFPCHCPFGDAYQTLALSVVREEKLSVLLQRGNTSRTEIWVTNKVDDTKVVSWSLALVVDLKPELELDIEHGVSFGVDEEKKVVFCCDKYFRDDESAARCIVNIVGEDNQVTQVDLGVESHWPILFNYAPSLAQLHQSTLEANE